MGLKIWAFTPPPLPSGCLWWRSQCSKNFGGVFKKPACFFMENNTWHWEYFISVDSEGKLKHFYKYLLRFQSKLQEIRPFFSVQNIHVLTENMGSGQGEVNLTSSINAKLLYTATGHSALRQRLRTTTVCQCRGVPFGVGFWIQVLLEIRIHKKMSKNRKYK